MRNTSIVTANRLVTLAGASLALFAGLAFAPTPFTQQATAGNGLDPNYRYCVSGRPAGGGPSGGGLDIPDCAFTTLAQCQAAASGQGYCIENPGYAPRVRRTGRG